MTKMQEMRNTLRIINQKSKDGRQLLPETRRIAKNIYRLYGLKGLEGWMEEYLEFLKSRNKAKGVK